MILSLYVVLIAISLIFIVIGLMKPDESVMALVGFLFLFLLSMVLLNGSLEYETGAEVTNSFIYDASGNINQTIETVVYSTELFNNSNSHTMGYYMVIVSIIGFVGVLLGLRSSWKRESERKERMGEDYK